MHKFEWDKSKNTKNKEKHNISFEEAIDAFYDYDSLILYDEKHSGDEDRFYQIGMIRTLKVIIVVFCIREKEIIRLISARETTKKEREKYERSKVKNRIC